MTNPDEPLISRNQVSTIYAILAALGVAFYLSWGLMFNVWFDVGVYTISAIMIAFGVIGFFLYSIED